MTPDFAPKGIGQILDSAVGLLRRHWREVGGAAAILLLPVTVLYSTAQAFYTRSFLGIDTGTLESLESVDTLQGASVMAGVANLAMLGFLLVAAFFAAAVYTAMPALVYGRRMSPVEILKGGWKRIVWYILTGLLLYTVLGIAGTFVIVVGIFTLGIGLVAGVPLLTWVLARLSLAPLISVTEDAGPIACLKRSWTLTKGNFWRLAGFSIAIALLGQVVNAAINSPVVIRDIVDLLVNAQPLNPLLGALRPVPLGWKLVEGLLGGVGLAATAPLGNVAWYFFYLDVRSRREGMDLYARASALGGDGA